jgi:hypothetical protein
MFERKYSTAFCVLVLCSGMAACKQNVDLAGISGMAKTVAMSNDALLAVPQDFYDSCVRQMRWSRGALPSSPRRPVTVESIVAVLPAEQATLFRKSTLKSLTSTTATEAFDVSTSCAPNKTASEQMIAVTSVLTSYFAALGKLADTGSTTGLGIDKLAKAVNGLDANAEFNKSGKTSAIAGALDRIASGLVAAKAKQDIAGDVVAANALVGKLIDRLISDKLPAGDEDNVAGFYLNQLGYERFAMHSFYNNNIGESHGGLERLEAFKYYADESDEDARLDKRIAATESYKSALRKLKQTHDDVAKTVASNDLASAQSLARALIQVYQPQIDSLRKAFK